MRQSCGGANPEVRDVRPELIEISWRQKVSINVEVASPVDNVSRVIKGAGHRAKNREMIGAYN